MEFSEKIKEKNKIIIQMALKKFKKSHPFCKLLILEEYYDLLL